MEALLFPMASSTAVRRLATARSSETKLCGTKGMKSSELGTRNLELATSNSAEDRASKIHRKAPLFPLLGASKQLERPVKAT
eukprot:scaffold1355_cov268-Pinguiococcus_pyrenoidosus.AAC.41